MSKTTVKVKNKYGKSQAQEVRLGNREENEALHQQMLHHQERQKQLSPEEKTQYQELESKIAFYNVNFAKGKRLASMQRIKEAKLAEIKQMLKWFEENGYTTTFNIDPSTGMVSARAQPNFVRIVVRPTAATVAAARAAAEAEALVPPPAPAPVIFSSHPLTTEAPDMAVSQYEEADEEALPEAEPDAEKRGNFNFH